MGLVEIVARAGADGAHVSGIDAVSEALTALKPERIVGVGGLQSRHDAMTAGEAGRRDYVLFGEVDENGHRPQLEAIVERVQWWAEVFEPPCVGLRRDAWRGGRAARPLARISFCLMMRCGMIRAAWWRRLKMRRPR